MCEVDEAYRNNGGILHDRKRFASGLIDEVSNFSRPPDIPSDYKRDVPPWGLTYREGPISGVVWQNERVFLCLSW